MLFVYDQEVPAAVQNVHRFVLLLVVVTLAQGQNKVHEAIAQHQQRLDDLFHNPGGEELDDPFEDFIDHDGVGTARVLGFSTDNSNGIQIRRFHGSAFDKHNPNILPRPKLANFCPLTLLFCSLSLSPAK